MAAVIGPEPASVLEKHSENCPARAGKKCCCAGPETRAALSTEEPKP